MLGLNNNMPKCDYLRYLETLFIGIITSDWILTIENQILSISIKCPYQSKSNEANNHTIYVVFQNLISFLVY